MRYIDIASPAGVASRDSGDTLRHLYVIVYQLNIFLKNSPDSAK